MARRPCRPDDLFRFALPGDPAISPDGRRVAYTVQTVDAEADEARTRIWLADLEGDAAPRPLTAGPKDRLARWSPDGRWLAFVSERSGMPQLWLIAADGGEARRLETDRPVTSAPAWSPDGRRIAFTAPVFDKPEDWEPYPGAPPGDRERAARQAETWDKPPSGPRVIANLTYRLDGAGYFGDRTEQVFVMDLAGLASAGAGDAAAAAPAVTRLTRCDRSLSNPVWSPDGRWLLCNRSGGPDDDVYMGAGLVVVDAASGAVAELAELPGTPAAGTWSPDGRRVAVIANPVPDGWAAVPRLYVVDAGDARAGDFPRPAAAVTALGAGIDRPFGSVQGCDPRYLPGWTVPPVWDGDGRRIFVTAVDGGTSDVHAVDLDGTVARATPAGAHAVGAFDARAGRLVYQCASAQEPDELYVCHTGAEPVARRLTDHNGPLREEVAFLPAEGFRYAGADGWDIEGWAIRPGSAPAPAVLSIHGGPHGVYGVGFIFHFQCLAAAGMAVVYTNPRGSSGYGAAFTEACLGDWGGKDYEDLMRGVDAAVARGWADPARLGVMGWSYGGFMTCWTVTQTGRFAAAVAGACIANLHSFYGTSDVGTTFGHAETGGVPWTGEGEEALLSRSAVRFADRVTTPVLLLHGEDDFRCLIEQTEQLYAALKRQGKVAVQVRYPGEAHLLRKPSNRLDRVTRTVAWFRHYLRP